MPMTHDVQVVPGIAKSIVHLAAGLTVIAMLAAAGQPILTDDVWMHLAFGRVYLQEGLELGADPFLFTSSAAPAAHAWLADVMLHQASVWAGFTGLRVLHAGLVASILLLVWSTARLVLQSRTFASLFTVLFVALAAYRLVQLRPELLTIMAAIALYRFWLREGAVARVPRDLAILCVLACLWANVHAGFLLGPILVAAALVGIVADALLGPKGVRRERFGRARHVGVLLIGTLVGSSINPEGPQQFLLYFVAGTDSAGLAQVSDEWAVFPFAGWPGGNIPPTPMVWTLGWAIFVTAGLAVAREAFLRLRPSNTEHGTLPSATVDPALVGLAAASLVAMALAVRFLWLGFFPVLLVGEVARRRYAERSEATLVPYAVAAGIVSAIAVGYFLAGPWAIVGQFWQKGILDYRKPFPPERYHGHVAWFLGDASLEGNAFNPYFMGSYLSYWLAPEIRFFVSGSLAMPDETIDASRQIVAARSDVPDETLTQLLDRHGIDLFIGVGLPDIPRLRRPWHHSTMHLRADAEWIQVFRNPESAVFLRRNDRNAANLDRVERYYDVRGVPFDRVTGFDPLRAIEEAYDWAVAHGVAPVSLPRHFLTGRARTRAAELDRLTLHLAALGECEALVERVAARAPTTRRVVTQRRFVWCLLQVGDRTRVAEEALRLERRSSRRDRLSLGIVDGARAWLAASPEEAAAVRSRLPLFGDFGAMRIKGEVARPAPRPPRR